MEKILYYFETFGYKAFKVEGKNASFPAQEHDNATKASEAFSNHYAMLPNGNYTVTFAESKPGVNTSKTFYSFSKDNGNEGNNRNISGANYPQTQNNDSLWQKYTMDLQAKNEEISLLKVQMVKVEMEGMLKEMKAKKEDSSADMLKAIGAIFMPQPPQIPQIETPKVGEPQGFSPYEKFAVEQANKLLTNVGKDDAEFILGMIGALTSENVQMLKMYLQMQQSQTPQ